MKVTCPDCNLELDDARQSTLCPHEHFRTDEEQAQWQAGQNLLGKIVRFNHMDKGSGVRCYAVDRMGMVSIEHYSGNFAPHLFVIDEGEAPHEQ